MADKKLDRFSHLSAKPGKAGLRSSIESKEAWKNQPNSKASLLLSKTITKYQRRLRPMSVSKGKKWESRLLHDAPDTQIFSSCQRLPPTRPAPQGPPRAPRQPGDWSDQRLKLARTDSGLGTTLTGPFSISCLRCPTSPDFNTVASSDSSLLGLRPGLMKPTQALAEHQRATRFAVRRYWKRSLHAGDMRLSGFKDVLGWDNILPLEDRRKLSEAILDRPWRKAGHGHILPMENIPLPVLEQLSAGSEYADSIGLTENQSNSGASVQSESYCDSPLSNAGEEETELLADEASSAWRRNANLNAKESVPASKEASTSKKVSFASDVGRSGKKSTARAKTSRAEEVITTNQKAKVRADHDVDKAGASKVSKASKKSLSKRAQSKDSRKVTTTSMASSTAPATAETVTIEPLLSGAARRKSVASDSKRGSGKSGKLLPILDPGAAGVTATETNQSLGGSEVETRSSFSRIRVSSRQPIDLDASKLYSPGPSDAEEPKPRPPTKEESEEFHSTATDSSLETAEESSVTLSDVYSRSELDISKKNLAVSWVEEELPERNKSVATITERPSSSPRTNWQKLLAKLYAKAGKTFDPDGLLREVDSLCSLGGTLHEEQSKSSNRAGQSDMASVRPGKQSHGMFESIFTFGLGKGSKSQTDKKQLVSKDPGKSKEGPLADQILFHARAYVKRHMRSVCRQRWLKMTRLLCDIYFIARIMHNRSYELTMKYPTFMDIGDVAIMEGVVEMKRRSQDGRSNLFDTQEFQVTRKEGFRLNEDVRRILDLRPSQRTDKDVSVLLYSLQVLDSFCNYPLHFQRQIARCADYAHLHPRRTIFREGHIPLNFYFILSGQAVVTHMNPEGFRQTLGLIGQGQSFGQESLAKEDAVREFTVVSRTDMQLLIIARTDYLQIFQPELFGDGVPDYIRFLSRQFWMEGWPVQSLTDHPDKCFVRYYRHERVVVRDSTCSDYLYVVRSGKCRVVMRLQAPPPSLKHLEQWLMEDLKPLEYAHEKTGTMERRRPCSVVSLSQAGQRRLPVASSSSHALFQCDPRWTEYSPLGAISSVVHKLRKPQQHVTKGLTSLDRASVEKKVEKPVFPSTVQSLPAKPAEDSAIPHATKAHKRWQAQRVSHAVPKLTGRYTTPANKAKQQQRLPLDRRDKTKLTWPSVQSRTADVLALKRPKPTPLADARQGRAHRVSILPKEDPIIDIVSAAPSVGLPVTQAPKFVLATGAERRPGRVARSESPSSLQRKKSSEKLDTFNTERASALLALTENKFWLTVDRDRVTADSFYFQDRLPMRDASGEMLNIRWGDFIDNPELIPKFSVEDFKVATERRELEPTGGGDLKQDLNSSHPLPPRAVAPPSVFSIPVSPPSGDQSDCLAAPRPRGRGTGRKKIEGPDPHPSFSRKGELSTRRPLVVQPPPLLPPVGIHRPSPPVGTRWRIGPGGGGGGADNANNNSEETDGPEAVEGSLPPCRDAGKVSPKRHSANKRRGIDSLAQRTKDSKREAVPKEGPETKSVVEVKTTRERSHSQVHSAERLPSLKSSIASAAALAKTRPDKENLSRSQTPDSSRQSALGFSSTLPKLPPVKKCLYKMRLEPLEDKPHPSPWVRRHQYRIPANCLPHLQRKHRRRSYRAATTYVSLQELGEGDVFGFDQLRMPLCVKPKSASVSLVSDGAELIALDKKFLISNASLKAQKNWHLLAKGFPPPEAVYKQLCIQKVRDQHQADTVQEFLDSLSLRRRYHGLHFDLSSCPQADPRVSCGLLPDLR